MKASIKQKQSSEHLGIDAAEFDPDDQLAIEPELLAEIKEKGHAYRWINASKFKEAYGYDARRWVPYKRESKPTGAFGFTDPEGYTRRGDLLLATRPNEIHMAHRAKNKRKTDSLAAVQVKSAAESIRKSMQEGNVTGAKIIEGYDDNE